MKKGCFFSVIILLTITVIAVFYIVKFHGEDLLEIGKDKLIEIAQEQIETDIANLNDGKYADSLRIVISKYFDEIDSMDVSLSLDRIEEFSDDIEVILMDSKIDSAEFDFVNKILTKYDKSKEN